MQLDYNEAILAVWSLVGIIWAAGAIFTKATSRVQSPVSRIIQASPVILAFFLLFNARIRVGPLGWRFVPESDWVAGIGLILTVAGAALAVWARILLGANWSAVVTVKEGHEIVKSGPYRLVRHPIYSGILLAMIGTALVYGEVGCIVALPLALAGWWMKLQTEELFMVSEFGEQYEAYRREVKALIPFVL